MNANMNSNRIFQKKVHLALGLALLIGCAAPVTNALADASDKTDEVSLAITPIAEEPASNLTEHLGNGQWTLVMFWSSVMGISMFQEVIALSAEADESTLSVVGVSIDEPGKINTNREKDFLEVANFPNYRADRSEIFTLYESIVEKPFEGTPSFLIFDRQGKVMAVEVGVIKRDIVLNFINNNE